MNYLLIILIAALVFISVYLFLVKPRNGVKYDWGEKQGCFYAHRGLWDMEKGIPENSMKAFARAAEAGYGIECDVQLTGDGIPVIFHDFTLERMCGAPGRVDEYTYEQLKEFRLSGTEESIPLFEDFLRLIDGRVPLIIEYKEEGKNFGVCTAAAGLLDRYKGSYVIESFNPFVLSWYKKNRNDIVRGQLSTRFLAKDGYKGPLYFMLGNLLMNFISRPDFIAYDHHYSNKLSFRITTGLLKGKPVAWTIRSLEELDKAAKRFDVFIFEKFIPEN